MQPPSVQFVISQEVSCHDAVASSGAARRDIRVVVARGHSVHTPRHMRRLQALEGRLSRLAQGMAAHHRPRQVPALHKDPRRAVDRPLSAPPLRRRRRARRL